MAQKHGKGGRPKGSPNKTTATLKEAILTAAAKAGSDGNGKDGLVGYLCDLAKNEKKAFAQLLGKVLPLQVSGEGGGPLVVQIVKFSDMDDDQSDPAE